MDLFEFIDQLTQNATRSIGGLFVLAGLIVALVTILMKRSMAGAFQALLTGGVITIIGAGIIVVGEYFKNTLDQGSNASGVSSVQEIRDQDHGSEII
jgi:xanthine/uracil permease